MTMGRIICTGLGPGDPDLMAVRADRLISACRRGGTGRDGSVEGALDSAGLTISEHDTVAPSIDTAISDGSQIVVERGRLLTLTIDGQTREVWTTATTVEEALAELGQNPAAFKLSADRSRQIPVDGLAMTADTLFHASVSVGGAAPATLQSSAKTVGDLLAEHECREDEARDRLQELEGRDSLDPAPVERPVPAEVAEDRRHEGEEDNRGPGLGACIGHAVGGEDPDHERAEQETPEQNPPQRRRQAREAARR